MEKDYYFILGISHDATSDAIKKAFRINAIKYHPDKTFGDPVFIQKFLEVKEAYDNLINQEKRKEFDLKYKTFSTKKDTHETKDFYNGRAEKKQQKQKEEKFKYNPYEQVFSTYDREQQDTPQYPPRQTPWGKSLEDNVEFVIFPKNIGKIIGGVSNIFKGEKKTTFILIKKLAKPFIISIVTIFVLAIFHYFFLLDLHKGENPLLYIIILWSLLGTLLLYVIYKMNIPSTFFYNYNYFIGINGFAFYKFKNSKDTPIEKIEINFNEVTDVLSFSTTNEFAWINRYSRKIIYREPAPNEKTDNIKFDLNRDSERSFTIYLLDNMEKKLQDNGYIEFIIAPYTPYIRLGIGFITFLKGEENFTYNFNEIKRVYTQEMNLYIEHKNYEKFLFFKSGNQNSVPLQFLCNRQFFYKAMEILLGYKIIE